MERSNRGDVYSRITADIIAAIEAGAGKFRMPWHHDGSSTSHPTNVASGKPYRGVNTLALWAAAARSGYADGLWGTYQQWSGKGAQVRRGERGATVVFWKIDARGVALGQEGDSDDARRRVFARAYTVFNSGQVDGFVRAEKPKLSEDNRIERAERFCGNLGVDIRHGGGSAFYVPSQDFVQMPDFKQFVDPTSYYAVLLHECGHASGAKHRLDRDLSGRFGTDAYAMEECVVELLSAMICGDLALSVAPRPDHARYIASWIKVQKNDTSAIFSASSKAQQAADWMHARQPGAASRRDAGEEATGEGEQEERRAA
jgi:antirestriction protein ArdC